MTAAFNSLATLDAVSFKGCNFPLHCKLQSELKKTVNLALRTFLVLIFLRRKVGRCLVLRFLRVCFLQGRASQTWTVGDGQISKETPNWIGLGWDGFKQSEVPRAEKLAKEQKDKLALTVTDRELNAGC